MLLRWEESQLHVPLLACVSACLCVCTYLCVCVGMLFEVAYWFRAECVVETESVTRNCALYCDNLFSLYLPKSVPVFCLLT
jgi:hypothetical protein